VSFAGSSGVATGEAAAGVTTSWAPFELERSTVALEQAVLERLELTRPQTLLVKNTFLSSGVVRSPSLDGFFQERLVSSCPATPVARTCTAAAKVEADVDVGSSSSTADTEATTPRPEAPHGCRRTRTWAPGEQESLAGPPATVPVLRLEQALGLRSLAPGMAIVAGPLRQAFLSLGSAGHFSRQCKPCAFVHTSGCGNGTQCTFCHICEPGEKKKRQKQKRAIISAMRELRGTGRGPAVAEAGETFGRRSRC